MEERRLGYGRRGRGKEAKEGEVETSGANRSLRGWRGGEDALTASGARRGFGGETGARGRACGAGGKSWGDRGMWAWVRRGANAARK